MYYVFKKPVVHDEVLTDTVMAKLSNQPNGSPQSPASLLSDDTEESLACPVCGK